MELTMVGHGLIKPFHFLTLALTRYRYKATISTLWHLCKYFKTPRHRRASLINIMYQAHGVVIDLPSMVICKLSPFLPNTLFSCQRPIKTPYPNVIFPHSKAHLELIFLCQVFPASAPKWQKIRPSSAF